MRCIAKLDLEDFSSELFSKAPVPGGGGAAAYIGALGVSLGAMAGNLTLGKKKYAAVEDDIRRMIETAEKLRQRLLALIDEDAVAFEPLSCAYSLPKDTPGYAETLKKVTLDACRAPLEMMRCCCRGIDLLTEMYEKCSRLMISDVGCGAVAAGAALKAAALNVFINTKSLRGTAEADAIEAESKAMLDTYLEKADAIADSVLNKLTEE